MKSFNDWKVYSQLLSTGILPVFVAVIIIAASFFGGLYELKVDAIAAQNIIHDIQADSYLMTSELREYLINLVVKRPNEELSEELDELQQRLGHSLTIYRKIAEEGEAANKDSLSDVLKIFNSLANMTSKIRTSDVDIKQINIEIENLENDINKVFNKISALVEKEIKFEMILLSWLVIGTSILFILGAHFLVQATSRKIEGQILELKNTTEAFGHGNFSDRIKISSQNEMGQLGIAFNSMADDLQSTLGSLEEEINRRKSSEQQLKESHFELEQKIKQRTGELKKTYQQVAHAGRLRALGEMATGIAHEIRQPLAIIDLANRSLNNFLEKKNNDQDLAKSSIFKIKEQIKRADNIINNMRSFARTDVSDFGKINLEDPVQIAASFFQEQCRLNQINFIVDAEKNLPFVHADSQKIEQVVVNLISNARFAVETKSLEIQGKYSMKIQINLYSDPEKKNVIFEVMDNGSGMRMEEKEKCLNPFFTSKGVGQGTGLGLSIVYNIIQEINGKIEIESDINVGSTFRIILPAKE